MSEHKGSTRDLYQSKPTADINVLISTNEGLKEMLNDERTELRVLESNLRESRNKYGSAIQVQTQLEQDLVIRDSTIESLQNQIKELKRHKRDLESTCSEDQMNYMNDKARWLDREAELEHTITKLKNQLAGETKPSRPSSTQFPTTPLPATPIRAHFASSSVSSTASSSFTSPQHPPPLPPKDIGPETTNTNTISVLQRDLEAQRKQLDQATRLHQTRYERLEKDLQELRSLNARLEQENEGFQTLLAEKTILGGFQTANLADELENDISDQADEDVEMSWQEHEYHKEIYQLRFETKALLNQNKALKLSLERLIHRLLDYKQFEKVVESAAGPAVNAKTVSAFQNRVMSAAASFPYFSASPTTSTGPDSCSASSVSSSPSSASMGDHLDVPKRRDRGERSGPVHRGMIWTANKTPSSWASLILGCESPRRLSSSSQTSLRKISIGVDDIMSDEAIVDSDIDSRQGSPRKPSIQGQKQLLCLRITSSRVD